MKKNNFAKNQKPPAASPRPAAPVLLSLNEINFTLSPDEVARRAYFTYVNQGLTQGREVRHWLQAEAELVQERNLTPVHGFHEKA